MSLLKRRRSESSTDSDETIHCVVPTSLVIEKISDDAMGMKTPDDAQRKVLSAVSSRKRYKRMTDSEAEAISHGSRRSTMQKLRQLLRRCGLLTLPMVAMVLPRTFLRQVQ